MIIEIPNENSIIKWKNDDKDEWKVTEISDLIKAYERPQGEWNETGYETGALGITYRQTQCSNCGWEHALPMWLNFCPNCGAEMRRTKE